MQTNTPTDAAVDLPKVVFYATAAWALVSMIAVRLLPDAASVADTAHLSPLLYLSPYASIVAMPAPVLVGWYMGLRGADDWVRVGILVLITTLAPIAWLWLGATLVAPEVPNSPLSRGLRTLRARAAGHPL